MGCATTISMCDAPDSKGSSHPTHRAPLVVTRSVRQFATCGLLASRNRATQRPRRAARRTQSPDEAAGVIAASLCRSASVPRKIEPGRFGAPGGNRTPDPQLRRLMLYPTELRAHKDLRDADGGF